MFGDENQIRENIAKCHQVVVENKAKQKFEEKITQILARQQSPILNTAEQCNAWNQLRANVDNLTEALNECYSTIAALESANKELKIFNEYAKYVTVYITMNPDSKEMPMTYGAWIDKYKECAGCNE